MKRRTIKKAALAAENKCLSSVKLLHDREDDDDDGNEEEEEEEEEAAAAAVSSISLSLSRKLS